MKKNELKSQILNVLKDIPKTRDSDITLTIEIWKRYYPSYIKKTANGSLGVWLDDLFKIPREDNVKRLRAIIQNNEGLYLPTTWAVARRRKIKEVEWLEYVRTNENKRI